MEAINESIERIPNVENQKIKFQEKIGYFLFSLSNQLRGQFNSTFLLYFFTNVLNIAPAVSGIILTLDRVWGAICDPLLGYYADNHRFKNGERARPFLLYCGIVCAVLQVLLFVAFDMPYYMKIAYALIIILLTYTFSTLLYLPSYVMPMLATNDQKQRVSLFVFISGGASIGVVAAMLIFWPLVRLIGGVNKNGTIINESKGFFYSSLVIAALLLFGALFNFFTSRERVKPINEKEEKIKIIGAFITLAKCKIWSLNLTFVLLYGLSSMMVTSCLVYFATYVLKNQGAVTIVMGAYALGSIGTLPVVGKFNKRFGRKNMMYFGAGIYLMSKIVWAVNPSSLVLTIINGFLMGVGVTFIIVINRSNNADVSDLIEWQNGRRMDNMISTTNDLILKIGGALGALLIGLVLQLSNYDPKHAVQPQSAITAIKVLIIYVPMAFDAIMVFIAYKLNIEEEVNKMNEWKKEKNLI